MAKQTPKEILADLIATAARVALTPQVELTEQVVTDFNRQFLHAVEAWNQDRAAAYAAEQGEY